MAYPSNRQPTVSTDSVAQDQIRAFVERILRMKEEAKAINDDIREIYAEAKGNGFDKTVLGQVVAYVEKRGKDRAALMEREALFDLYMEAFDGSSSHARARAREIIEEFRPDVVVSDHVDQDGHRLRVIVDPRIAEILGRSDAEPHDPETGEIIEGNEPASSEAQVRADRSEWPDRQNEPDHSPDAGKMVNEPATAPPTVGGPVEGVAPPASSATNFPVTVEGSSSTGGTDVGGDGEAHSMPDKSGEGDAPSPSPAPGNGEPTNVVALPVRKPSDRPFSSSGLERPYGCLHVDACPKTWRDTEPCSMCRAAIAVEAGGTAVRHQGSIGQ